MVEDSAYRVNYVTMNMRVNSNERQNGIEQDQLCKLTEEIQWKLDRQFEQLKLMYLKYA